MRDWMDGASIRFEAPVQDPTAGTVYVGAQPPGLGAGLTKIGDSEALVLTSKGAPGRAVARYVAAAPDIETWRTAMAFATDRPFAGKTVVVEDASPDTCLALVTLARRLSGQAVPDAWLDFAERWESGYTASASGPERSWGALHSALVHGLIDRDPTDVSGMVTTSLIAGCRLVEGLIETGVAPDEVSESPRLQGPVASLLASARAALAATRDIARTTAATSTVVQLDLPIAGLPGHRRTVDAILVIDRAVVDAKSYLRRDPSSPSGQGFAFLALQRPSERGTGNDITFSVDPDSGVWMRDLWLELERREWQAWEASGENRPETPPRPIASFMPRDGGAPLSRPCAQPWYDTDGDYTLVAAPRSLEDGRLGSKLTWDDALDAVWRLYAPVNALGLCTRDDGKPVDFFSGARPTARAPAADRHALRVIHLQRPHGGTDAVWTGTIARTCAAFLAHGKTGIDRLPSPSDFDVVSGRAGHVVVSSAGALTVEISHDAGFPLDALKMAIERAAETLRAAIGLEERMAAARRTALKAMQESSGRARTEALAEIFAVLAEALEHRSDPPAQPEDPFVAALTDVLERRWRSAARFRAVIAEANEVRDMVVASSDVRANEMIGWIAVYGFPFAALVNFFAFAFADQRPDNVLRGITLGGLEVLPILAWVGTSVFLVVVLNLVVRRRNRAWKTQIAMKQRQPRQPRG